MEKIKNIWFDEKRIYLKTTEGRILSRISSFYETSEPNDQNEVAEMFKRFPWLNVSEVARAIGINKSLLARYIYGISKPSEQRLQQIRLTLHALGTELQTA